LIGNGFFVWKQKIATIRNLKISKVRAANGDAVGIPASSRVWVDHCDLGSDQERITMMVSSTLPMPVTSLPSLIPDHFKGSLVGHSDKMARKIPAISELRSTTTYGQLFIAGHQAFDSEPGTSSTVTSIT
jgi:pectate lyase